MLYIGSYGAGRFGLLRYGRSLVEYEPPIPPEPVVQEQAVPDTNPEWDFPLRFSPNCDIVRTTTDAGIKNNLITSVFIRHRGIPLRVILGSQMSLEVFDPEDEAHRHVLAVEVVRSTAVGEPRAAVADCLVTESEGTTKIIAPYKVKQTGRWQDLILDAPLVK